MQNRGVHVGGDNCELSVGAQKALQKTDRQEDE